MSGLFGIVSNKDCVETLFYGIDYQSHLGTQRAGMTVLGRKLCRAIHNISTSQFKSKFIEELSKMSGKAGIGVISDFNPQPIIISSQFGDFAIVTTGLLRNRKKFVSEILRKGGSFSEMSAGEINSTEIVGKIIASKKNIEEGINYFFAGLKGSISLLILSKEGIYAARDIMGRTTLAIGKKAGERAIASETCAFPNLGFQIERQLLPGEIVLVKKDSLKRLGKVNGEGKTCSFLWIYTGYPASTYDGVSVEVVRERCGANLARADKKEGLKADFVTGVPDSGVAHGLGYAQEYKIPYRRSIVKYTPGYGRSYTPPSQKIRDQVAKMKLIPISEVVKGQRIVICDDSIVRGTQLKNQVIEKLWQFKAKEIHVRIACPPLLFACPYLLSTRTNKELAARRSILNNIDRKKIDIGRLLEEEDAYYQKMVEGIRKELNVTSLKYQTLKDMVEAIGLPKGKLCLYCWNGKN